MFSETWRNEKEKDTPKIGGAILEKCQGSIGAVKVWPVNASSARGESTLWAVCGDTARDRLVKGTPMLSAPAHGCMDSSTHANFAGPPCHRWIDPRQWV